VIGTKLVVASLAASLAVVSCFTIARAAVDPFALIAEYDRVAAKPLWPKFDARQIPLAIYDGRSTFLFRHPHPPPEFKPDRAGASSYHGLHEAIRANTSIQLGGVTTAALKLDEERRSPRALASIVIHEAFHVHQRRHHPGWIGNEGELFLYPTERESLLALRRLETLALRRALDAASSTDRARWSAAAIEMRRLRYASLPSGSVEYERGTELNEGLARYVEGRAAEERPILSAYDYPAPAIRGRCYATGQALAILLDRMEPAWKDSLEAGSPDPLDVRLERALEKSGIDETAGRAFVGWAAVPFTERERESAMARAAVEVGRLAVARDSIRREYLSRPGNTLIVIADSEPLWPQGFDPLNVMRLSSGEVLHSRWIKLGNAGGTVEVLDRAAITEPAGRHPILEGIRKVVLSGLEVTPSGGSSPGPVKLSSGGVTLEFRNAVVERDGGSWVVRQVMKR